jgi:predicted enzyme related to lactoylglutathione lyase
MPEFINPVIGNFCWVEANLADPARGKGFYGELFGWAAEDMPMPQGTYTMFKLGSRQVAGMLDLPEGARKMGAPSHWLNYVAVDDVASATRKAEELGAKVLHAPTAVGPGTMSVIQDPTGGVLALWATQQSMGTFLYGETHALCWNEFVTPDIEVATAFYVGLFGWKPEVRPMGDTEYTVLKYGDQLVAGLMPKPANLANEPMSWMTYFAVADCDATAAQAARLGGTVVHPPADIPNVGRFALLLDNQDAAFAIIQNFPRS